VTDIVYLMDHNLVPTANIFIDSPLANKATEIFRKHANEIENGADLAKAFASPLVRATESVEDSKALNNLSGFNIIIAASGMAEAGRIRHHLLNHLWQKSTTVLLVGFQAGGSLGSLLENGEKNVRIMGQQVAVAATIRRIEDYSGHADGPELVAWIKARLPITKNLFLTHGEEEGGIALANDVKSMVQENRIIRPALDEAYDLSGDLAILIPSDSKPRIAPETVAVPDWHNDTQSLIMDMQNTLKTAATDKDRAVILRKIKRALTPDDTTLNPANTQRRRPYRARGFDES
jgi:metallo-beta-lactamase family protein